jgi:hypothetical protein
LKPPIPIQSASSLKSSVTGSVALRRKSLEFIPEILSTRIEQVSKSKREIDWLNWFLRLYFPAKCRYKGRQLKGAEIKTFTAALAADYIQLLERRHLRGSGSESVG